MALTCWQIEAYRFQEVYKEYGKFKIQTFETNRFACLDSNLEGEQLPKLVSVRLEIPQPSSRRTRS